jgi:hypothetical protein
MRDQLENNFDDLEIRDPRTMKNKITSCVTITYIYIYILYEIYTKYFNKIIYIYMSSSEHIIIIIINN